MPRSSPARSVPALTTSQNESPGAAWVTTSMRMSSADVAPPPELLLSVSPPPLSPLPLLSSPVLQPALKLNVGVCAAAAHFHVICLQLQRYTWARNKMFGNIARGKMHLLEEKTGEAQIIQTHGAGIISQINAQVSCHMVVYFHPVCFPNTSRIHLCFL